jgi:hypothetical protein
MDKRISQYFLPPGLDMEIPVFPNIQKPYIIFVLLMDIGLVF